MQDGTKFCTSCGASMNTSSAPHMIESTSRTPAYSMPTGTAVLDEHEKKARKIRNPDQTLSPSETASSKFELMSSRGTLGAILLMSVPIIGWIFMGIWALGGCRKLQKKYLARAWVIITIIMLVTVLVLWLVYYFKVAPMLK